MQQQHFFHTLALVSLLGAPMSPAPLVQGSTPPDALEVWRTRHGEAWQLTQGPLVGKTRLLHGRSVMPPARPGQAGDFQTLALGWLQEAERLLELDISTLSLRSSEAVPLGASREKDREKWVVVFDQWIGGLQVQDGSATALFDLEGRLLALESNSLVALTDDLDPIPQIDLFAALQVAEREFVQRAQTQPELLADPELFIQTVGGSVSAGDPGSPRPVWRFDLGAPRPGEPPVALRILVAADDPRGSVAGIEPGIHRCQSPGPQYGLAPPRTARVETLATPGTTAGDSFSNPPRARPLPFAYVQTPNGEIQTFGDGSLSMWRPPSAPTPITIEYRGPWAEVHNAAGMNYTLDATVVPGTAQRFLLNDPASEFVTAQANAFLGINRFRSYIRSVNPSDFTMNRTVEAYVNDTTLGTCVAYYLPADDTVHFSPSFSFWCRNLSFSTVVAHEVGHYANVLYGSGNGPDGFGEGAADVWGMYIYDTNIVGEDSLIVERDGENLRQFCGDNSPGCYGQVHADGEVLMGALWKVRRNLKASHGDALGSSLADALLIAWFRSFDDSQIHSILQTHWLLLDDDDGDLANGTPNAAEIEAAFAEQGFPQAAIALPQAEFFASDGSINDFYGNQAALTDSWALIGAYNHDLPSTQDGAVYAYERVGSNWSFRQKLSSPVSNDIFFGDSLAATDTTLAVGALDNDLRGSVHVYTRSGSSWLLEQTLVPPGLEDNDQFGSSVTLADNSTLIAGAPLDDDQGNFAGAVYVFTKSGSTWSFQQKLVQPVFDHGNWYGFAVAADGDTLVVGAPRSNNEAYVYERSGQTWSLDQTLLPFGPGMGADLGQDVDLRGDLLVLGAPDYGADDLEGAAAIYRRVGGTWQKDGCLRPLPGRDRMFGASVALANSSRLYVGDSGDHAPVLNAGSVYTFDRTGSAPDAWTLVRKQYPSSEAGRGNFGASLAATSTRYLVGAAQGDGIADRTGIAFLYDAP